MKVQYSDFQKLLPTVTWSPEELANKLSEIGHETTVDNDMLDISLTANRRECQDLQYLAFDLAGVFNLKSNVKLPDFGHSRKIVVTYEDINKILGTNIRSSTLKELERLGFVVDEGHVLPPDFRDVSTKADVAEEVLRIIGYNKLPIKLLSQRNAPNSPEYLHLLKVKAALYGAGLVETATSSFTSEGSIELKNPFSKEEPYLRPSMLIGLLKTLAKNPFLKRAAFYETGKVFEGDEKHGLGVLLAGYKDWEEWQFKISRVLGREMHFVPVNSHISEKLNVKQKQLYWVQSPVASLNPVDSEMPAVFNKRLPAYKPISKFPSLTRDITLIDPAQPVPDLIEKAHARFSELLFAEIIDRYTNPESSKVSVTVRFIFQKMNDSFTESEINHLTQKLTDFLK